MLTPLFLALVAIGSTDVLFEFDSIPAVFGITDHAYIVFVVNALALLGLRPLFFLVSGLLDRLVYMSTGLAVILAFIGVKLVLEFAHKQNRAVPEISTLASLGGFAHKQNRAVPEISTLASLGGIAGVLGITAAATLIASRRAPGRQAHAGSLRTQPERPAPPERHVENRG